MKIIKIASLVLILIVFLQTAQKTNAAASVNAYFSNNNCADKITNVSNKNTSDLGEKSLSFCFDGGQTTITGFSLEITCGGDAVDCKRIEAGDGAGRFNTEADSFKETGANTFGASKFNVGTPVSGKLNIAKITFDVKQGNGSISISGRTNVTAHPVVDAQVNRDNVRISELATGDPPAPQTTPVQVPPGGSRDESTPDGTWIADSEVTFAGKTAARSSDFLNWVLERYEWSKLDPSKANPFTSFWLRILGNIYLFALLLVLIGAFVMIITRGRSVTIMRFIPRFIMMLLLIAFSFGLIQFIYVITDIIQGIFLKGGDTANGVIISSGDLLNIDFSYKDFIGYRLSGAPYDESVFISLLLVKLTALTYYIMSGVLLIRKVVLWFFIIMSPVFPLLILYSPVRNTAKIWIGEFFRWVLYAPIFAILLSGLVSFWRSYIPLMFNFTSTTEVRYPTAVNILLGGPGQEVSRTNSINLPDTFIQYIIALLMLWAVIVLPFILLKIFLDYIFSLATADNTSSIRQIINSKFPFLDKYTGKNPPIPPVSPMPPKLTGMAKALPFVSKLPGSIFNTKTAATVIPDASPVIPAKAGIQKTWIPDQVGDDNGKNRDGGAFFNTLSQPLRTTQQSLDKTKDILRSINVNVPTIRDIARYDASINSSDIKKREEATNIIQKLEKIVNPLSTTSSRENHQFNAVRDQLVKESVSNNSFASLILQAASRVVEQKRIVQISEKLKQIAVPSMAQTLQEREQYSALRSQLVKESTNNNSFATSILSFADNVSSPSSSKEKQVEITSSVMEKLSSEKQKGNPLASVILSAISPAKTAAVQGGIASSPAKQTALPVVNRVQTVSLDDYEAVKEMWVENYKKLDVPVSISGSQKGRLDWIKEEMAKITETIGLLTSSDVRNVDKGMQSVGNILPFLLIGGFSQTEIIAYLKAKLQAGKTVLDEINKKEEEEETQVETQKTVEEKPMEMTTETAAENITDELKDQSANYSPEFKTKEIKD